MCSYYHYGCMEAEIMTTKQFPVVQIVIMAMIFLVGCAGAGDNPAIPPVTGEIPGITSPAADEYVPHSLQTIPRVTWAWYDVEIDPETWQIEIIPDRNLGFTFNVTQFLQPPAGNPANLGLTLVDTSQWISNGLIDLDISITHPFPGNNKLRGFDVMGVFMSAGSVAGYNDTSVLYPVTDGSEAYLINTDGYTRWMNATEFTQAGLLGFTPGSKGIPGFYPTATINGYKYFTEFLGSTDDLPTFFQNATNIAARGSFKAGSTLTRLYQLKFPLVGGKPQIRFQYAILASWAAADPTSLPNPAVTDFPPAANLQEPIHLSVTDNGSTLYYIDATDFGGNLILNIEIFDWQGAANPLGIPGEISHLYIEDATGAVIPGGSIDAYATATVTSGAGNSSVYMLDIANCTPQSTGRQEFLITVESANPTSYDQGFAAPFPATAPLAAFARYSATVSATNPCPTPVITGPNGVIYNINDVVTQLPITGTGFQGGAQLAAEMRRTSGNITGTNVAVNSSTTAEADFDFTVAAAGMYDFYFMNGCGVPAALLLSAVEINTPPTSTGTTGPTTGDGTLGIVNYNANASDSDTDPVDTLTYTWNVIDTVSSNIPVGPVTGDPLSFDYQLLPVAQYDVECVISDGHLPADITTHYAITRSNTQPTVNLPAGPNAAWYNTDILTYNAAATDVDPGQTLTYTWSFVPMSTIPSFVLPGDPIPGDITINFATAAIGPGWYDLECRVDDGSGAGNATAMSGPFAIYVADDPYVDPIPPPLFNQVITPGVPTLQGVVGCPMWSDSFFAALGTVGLFHPDISILSGPSLGIPGVMVIADEMGVLTGVPAPPMGWAHFTCPYTSGSLPSWWWWNAGLFPAGPDMFPSVVHFDGNSAGEIFVTNAQLTNKLIAFGVPDPSAFQHYTVGGPWMNDLYTSLPSLAQYDCAVDTSNGFDMGSPGSPMSPPMYGLYTQDVGGILNACGGPFPGVLAVNPVNFLLFPSGGTQPVGAPVDAPVSAGVVAPMPAAMVGAGPGLFNIAPGAACPAGAITFPEPYYALAIDDDPADNFFVSNLPLPVNFQVVAATIDSDRDVEIYEIDYGIASPGPANIAHLTTIPMGTFFGGSLFAWPMDVEFISNFSGFGGTPKPLVPDDMLAVLISDTVLGISCVEIYSISSGAPVFVSQSMPCTRSGVQAGRGRGNGGDLHAA